MKYLTFNRIPGGYDILFNGKVTGDKLVLDVDGSYYFLPTSYRGGHYTDYILREIVEKLEELNKGRL